MVVARSLVELVEASGLTRLVIFLTRLQAWLLLTRDVGNLVSSWAWLLGVSYCNILFILASLGLSVCRHCEWARGLVRCSCLSIGVVALVVRLVRLGLILVLVV